MKKRVVILMAMLAMGASILEAQAQKPATDIPNISLIGNFLATHTEDSSEFNVKEIELSFQHYLYPSVKADIFTALHKEEDGSRNFELEEAYITFSDLISVLFPNTAWNPGTGAIIGKKKLGIGKINPLHPEQWSFVDRPLVLNQFLGGDEGLSAEGGQLNHLLPLPFFSQLEVGVWTAAPHAHDHDEESEEEEEGVEFSNRLFTGRLWNSVALSPSSELEIGLNYLLSNATASSTDDKSSMVGLDFTLTKERSKTQKVTVQSEFFQATYGHEGEERNTQSGAYISGMYTFNSYYKAGLRLGTLGKHGDEGEVQDQLSVILTRNLTETSQFRLQANTGNNSDTTFYAQFLFGMGPHSHVLQ